MNLGFLFFFKMIAELSSNPLHTCHTHTAEFWPGIKCLKLKHLPSLCRRRITNNVHVQSDLNILRHVESNRRERLVYLNK